MRATTLRRRDEIADLEPAWRRLWRRCGRANPFIHPAWVMAWLDHLGQGVEALVAAVHQDSELAAVAPLGVVGFGPWRRAVFLGSPEADYPDLLSTGEKAVAEELLEELLRQRWDWLDLADLPADSRHVDLLRNTLAINGLSPKIIESPVCPVVIMDRPWEEYWAAKRRKFRYNLKRSRRLLSEEIGRIDHQVLTEARQVAGALSETMLLHAARWSGRHTRTIFSRPQGRSFFMAALPPLAQEGLVRLDLLRAGGRLAAFSLSFVGEDRLLYYIPGFDPEIGKYSPGTLLLWSLIAQAHRNGLRIFDLMKGEEDYKSRWANEAFTNRHLLAARPNLWARSGLGLRMVALEARNRVRQDERARRIYFGLRNRLTRQGRG